MCLAYRISTRASHCSRLSLLETSLSYPWLMAEELPSSFGLRTFCEYQYRRKIILTNIIKFEQHFRTEKKRTSIASMFVVCDPKPSNNSSIHHCGLSRIKNIFADTHQQSTSLCQPMSHPSCTCYPSWKCSTLDCTRNPPIKHPCRLPSFDPPS